MVWLNAANENGSGLYLNIHRIDQRSRSLFSLHGTMGDGYYEGEVLIEVGAGIDVTFADAWLDRSALDEFFRRAVRTDVEAALAEQAADLLFCKGYLSSFKDPLGSGVAKEIDLDLPVIKEGEVFWEAA
jgi:hypothetical protein